MLGGYYLEIVPWLRWLAAELCISDVQTSWRCSVPGSRHHGEGRNAGRHSLSRDLICPQAIARTCWCATECGTVPLGEVADIGSARGLQHCTSMHLATYVFVDICGRGLGGYVADAKTAVNENVELPAGTYVIWSGQYEYFERAEARLKTVVPVTLMIIVLLLYLNFRSLTETLIVMLSLPFALVCVFWLMWWLGFNLSIAVAVGFIALAASPPKPS